MRSAVCVTAMIWVRMAAIAGTYVNGARVANRAGIAAAVIEQRKLAIAVHALQYPGWSGGPAARCHL